MPAARKIGSYQGKPVYRVPVRVVLNNSQGRLADWINPPSACVEIIARSAVEAANYVRDLVAHRPETEVFAYGPKGGETHRFVGWESSIFHQMTQPRSTFEQLSLSL